MLRFSANLGFLWADLPLTERIARAAQAGFRAVELHWPYELPGECVRHACVAEGVTLLIINTPVGDATKGDFGLGAVSGREIDFRRELDQAIGYCRASGARAIHVMAGDVAKQERTRGRRVFRDNLELAAKKAASAGLTLLLEPINQRDRPDYFYSRTAEAVSLVEEIGSDAVRLMFDVYHVAIAEGDVIMRLRRYRDVIGHVQIAGVPCRTEPDRGEIAYRAIFDELERIGYQGWIGCEYRPRGSVEDGLVWMNLLGVSP